MKLILNLIKKEFLLAKNYLLITLATAIFIPLFVNSKIGNIGGSFIIFFITVIYTEYLLYNSISIVEHKYKGSYLLSATPFSRNTQVKAKYIFILIIFLLCFFIYNIIFMIFAIPKLNLFSTGLTLLITSIFFGLIIPIQYKFGYEKTKYISATLIFLTPFLLPKFLQNIASKNYTFKNSEQVYILLFYLLSIIFLYFSAIISIYIYSKKDF